MLRICSACATFRHPDCLDVVNPGSTGMAIDTISTALRTVALFRDLSDTHLESLTRQVVRRRYSRNELIFSQGDPGDGLYIMTGGHAGITRQNPEGDELIFTLYEPGEYF